MKLYILSTCDIWKSTGSKQNYYIGTSSKAGTARLAKVIAKGIKDGYFLYGSIDFDIMSEEDRWQTRAAQIAELYDDLRSGCTSFYYDLQSKLQYGMVELQELNGYC